MIKTPEDLAVYMSDHGKPISKWASEFILENQDIIINIMKRFSAMLLAATCGKTEPVISYINNIWVLSSEALAAVTSIVLDIPEIELYCDEQPEIRMINASIDEVKLPFWMFHIIRKHSTCNWDSEISDSEKYAKKNLMSKCRTALTKYVWDVDKIVRTYTDSHSISDPQMIKKRYKKYFSEIDINLKIDDWIVKIYGDVKEAGEDAEKRVRNIFNMIV